MHGQLNVEPAYIRTTNLVYRTRLSHSTGRNHRLHFNTELSSHRSDVYFTLMTHTITVAPLIQCAVSFRMPQHWNSEVTTKITVFWGVRPCRSADPKISRFTAPLLSQQFLFTAPLGQNKYLTLPFNKQLGQNHSINVCPNNLAAVWKNNTNILKEKNILKYHAAPRRTVWESAVYDEVKVGAELSLRTQWRYK